MYTLSRSKGQSLMGPVVIASLVLIVMFVGLLYSSIYDKPGQRLEQSIDRQLGQQVHYSTLTVTLEDRMWRANTENYDMSEYDNRTAMKVISYYFSAEGDTVYIDGNDIPRSKVKDDLEHYLNYRLETFWSRGPDGADYYLRIRDQDSDREIVAVSERPSAGDAFTTEFDVATYNGETARATFTTQGAQGLMTLR